MKVLVFERDCMSQKKNKRTQKMTPAQRAAKIEAAQARQAEQKMRREHAASWRKIGIIVVCVVLVLALGLPTVALSVLGNKNQDAASNASSTANTAVVENAANTTANLSNASTSSSSSTSDATSNDAAVGPVSNSEE